jgi:hypothetical protein
VYRFKSVGRGQLKNPLWLAFWLTVLLAQSGITVAIPRWNFTSFPIYFLPLRRASGGESALRRRGGGKDESASAQGCRSKWEEMHGI